MRQFLWSFALIAASACSAEVSDITLEPDAADDANVREPVTDTGVPTETSVQSSVGSSPTGDAGQPDIRAWPEAGAWVDRDQGEASRVDGSPIDSPHDSEAIPDSSDSGVCPASLPDPSLAGLAGYQCASPTSWQTYKEWVANATACGETHDCSLDCNAHTTLGSPTACPTGMSCIDPGSSFGNPISGAATADVACGYLDAGDDASTDARSDASTDGPSDVAPEAASTCAFDHAYSWQSDGGLAIYRDEFVASVGSSVTVTRMYMNDDTGSMTRQCSVRLAPATGDVDAGAVDICDAVATLHDADVVDAWAASDGGLPKVFGLDLRGSDGSVFVVSRGSQSFAVGAPCDNTSASCVAIPAGLTKVAFTLGVLDQEILADPACSNL